MIFEDRIKSIIDDALWAPTPDNVQYWRFDLSNSTLMIEINTLAYNHPIDPDFHTGALSMGGLLEYLAIAAPKWGLKFNWVPITSMKLQLQFSDDSSATEPTLYPFLKKRYTDRRAYLNDPVSEVAKTEILSTNQEYNSKISFLSDSTNQKKLIEYLYDCETQFFGENDIFSATLEWVKFNTNENPKKGLSDSNLGLSKLDTKIMSFLQNRPKLLNFLMSHGLNKISAKKSVGNFQKSGDFILFSCKGKSETELFEVGRHALKAWLILTKHGYTAQPLTLSSLSCFQVLASLPLPPIVEKNRDLFLKGTTLLREQFNLTDESNPCWLFRVGQGNAFTEKMRLSRLTSKDLLNIVVNPPHQSTEWNPTP